jgi:hypothetical protein
MRECWPGEEVSRGGQGCKADGSYVSPTWTFSSNVFTAASQQATNGSTHMNLRLRTFIPISDLSGPYLVAPRLLRHIGPKLYS